MTSKRDMAFFTKVEPPQHLFEAVLAYIALARRRAARIRLAALGTVMVVSVAALVPSINYAIHEFYASGFYDYLSLFFSDSSVAFGHWPSLAVLLLLGFSIALLWSLRRIAPNVRMAMMPIQSA